MRKRSLIISLILLLIGGGGVAFYSHLRKHDAPPLQEVMSYFSDSSSSIGIGEGWRLVAYESFTSIFNPHPWLAALGFERQNHETDIFRFERESTGETAELTVVHVEKKILEATFSASSPTAAFSLEQNVLRKFPHLARRMKPSHGSALPPP